MKKMCLEYYFVKINIFKDEQEYRIIFPKEKIERQKV